MSVSMRVSLICLIAVVGVGCAAPSTSYQSEFGGYGQPGVSGTSPMSRGDMHAAIEYAYLDGELTAEQARKIHLQLQVKGHLTQEQMAVISRDRMAKRDTYESNKESLDVIRDTAATGSSVLSDVQSTISTIRDIFN